MIERRTILAATSSFFLANCAPDAPNADSQKARFIKEAMQESQQRLELAEAQWRALGALLHMSSGPTIVPFSDWDYYYTRDAPIVWVPNKGQVYQSVSVPIGFISDLASVPRVFWSILPRQGRYAYAAMIHDYLYWEQGRPREEADTIFKIAMEDSQVDGAVVETLYRAVSIFGESAWKHNTKLKAAGEKRIMKRFPPRGDIGWDDWRKQKDIFAD